MPVAQRQRVGTPRRVVPSTGGGGGGNNLNSWKGYGDDDGSYNAAQSKMQSLRGAFTGVIDQFSKEVGDPFRKQQLISSTMAGKADAFAKTKAPQYVANAKQFYAGAAKSSDADLKIKGIQTEFAMHHSVNLVNQQEQDHKVARQQMNNVVAQATQRWYTTEEFLSAQGSLQQLASQTTAL